MLEGGRHALTPSHGGHQGDDLVVVPVLRPIEGIAVFLGLFEVFDVQPGQQGEQGVTAERCRCRVGSPVVSMP
jgi:hypothetical protein